MSIPYSTKTQHTTPVQIHPPPDLDTVGDVSDGGGGAVDVVDPVKAVMLKTVERYAKNFAANENLIYEMIAKMRMEGESWRSLDCGALERHSISEAKYLADRLKEMGYETRIVRRWHAWHIRVKNPDKKESCCVQ